MSAAILYACSRCFSRHPFEELSPGQQLCKECRGAFPIVKCTYCRSEFQQSTKGSTSAICKKCEQNVKTYGKPSACEYCNIIAAFIGNKCQRCTNSEIKYGPPVNCEQCKQKCAFDRHDDDKKVDGKLLCWLCTLSYKRALAKTKQGDADRRHIKLSQNRHKKEKLRSHNKRPKRIDVTKMQTSDSEGPTNSKIPRNSSSGPLMIVRGELDPNSSDHVVAMTHLKEQIATLQKQLNHKEQIILGKDKQITELKAKHFTYETELRAKMQTMQKEHENKVELLNTRIQALLREIASLSKSTKRSDRLAAARAESSNNSGSGTDSPTIH